MTLNLNALSLRKRLLLAFGILLLLAAMSSALALRKLAEIESNLETVVTQNNVKLDLSYDMAESVHIVSRVMRTIALLHEDSQIAHEMEKISHARATYDKARAALDQVPTDEAGLRARKAIDDARARARPLNDQVIELARQHKDEELLPILMQSANPATQVWQDALDANIALVKRVNLARYEDAQAEYAEAKHLLIGFGVLASLLALALAWLVTRSIVNELGAEPAEVARVARAIADAQLDVQMSTRTGDQQSVMAAMQRMQQSLSQLVASMRGNAESVATASAQIAQGNQDLSQRTEEQASALQQTAATMDQLSGTVRHNADSAIQANQMASSAGDVASRGGQVVSAVVDKMRGINDSSRKIADIIGVIDGIAFQTNILALNAAVEAARAGEQGRGFAVVAGEVRVLAQRSAEAAKEIKTLITHSVEQVEQGSHLVDQAGRTMSEIVQSVQRVQDIVAEISAASTEQSQGVNQIGQAMSQMDQTTQQNAALVEEGAAAAESLRQQAQQLLSAASVFKLAAQFQATAGSTTPAANASPRQVASTAIERARSRSAVQHAAERTPVEAGNEWTSF